ncbi:MAG: M20/M25/M40 family metallo-hydrolase [Betaproteobacteria bacterium]|nr:M20/M25/M40 family metallo-hydrolase [Betaproteobacteria bacterium]MDH3435874.1 M20/M25/M40 family metallo-hydrolase [Betaproteobacteria bacterium]
MFGKLRFALRMLFWLTVAAAIAWLLWYMVKVPGMSYTGALQPLTAEGKLLADRLSRHVATVASREHNFMHPVALEAAARYIETAFEGLGYGVVAQRIPRDGTEVRNIEIEVPGKGRRDEIIVIGAHYDSVSGAPGANDNGSGVAALIELARLLHDSKPARTVRFVAFVDEEPPFYSGEQMGSRFYARHSKARGENIVAMFSLETIGYYSDEPASQRYPFPLSFFYPKTGNFIAFVANLSSRPLLHDVIASFRRHAQFPSEGAAAPALLPGVGWSDHWSFWKEGYPALMVTDTAPYRYPHYHTMQDTPDKVDYERLARVVTGLHGMLRDLAQIPEISAADKRR